MRDSARAAGARLLVILIPNKEAVFYPIYREQMGTPSATYSRLFQLETLSRQDLEHHLQASRIDWFDPRPALELALRHNGHIYPEGGDGHVTGKGYVVLGAAVYQEIKRRQW